MFCIINVCVSYLYIYKCICSNFIIEWVDQYSDLVSEPLSYDQRFIIRKTWRNLVMVIDVIHFPCPDPRCSSLCIIVRVREPWECILQSSMALNEYCSNSPETDHEYYRNHYQPRIRSLFQHSSEPRIRLRFHVFDLRNARDEALEEE